MRDAPTPAHLPAPIAASYDRVIGPIERTVFQEHRRWLGADVDGCVLDLGGGTGRQIEHLQGADRIILVEPDSRMHRHAEVRGDVGPGMSIITAQGEALPLADGSCDHVVASLVLCTVRDVRLTLAEAHRVLRPGGEFRFFEHVADDGAGGLLQHAINPLWGKIAGGCQLTRTPVEAVRATPGLRVESVDRLSVGVPPVYPCVRGVAIAE